VNFLSELSIKYISKNSLGENGVSMNNAKGENMATVMTYRGYHGSIEIDSDAGVLCGRVIDSDALVSYQGMTLEELRSSFEGSIDEYLEFCKEKGIEPAKPYSGKFVTRVTPELHRLISIISLMENKSLNDVVIESIENYAAKARSEHPDVPELQGMALA
jgi:predicted HicB family RNase H-like nuclease